MLQSRDGERGANFLTEEIAEIAFERAAQEVGAVDRFRLLNNTLSSQPLCFNLFAPLVRHLDRATRLMAALLPNEVAEVLEVSIEFAPAPAQEYLGDRTAFDAFVSYRSYRGRRVLLAIETKLTEAFSQQVYDGPRYRFFTNQPSSPWSEHGRANVADLAWNQLWRNHLLAESMIRHPSSAHGDEARLCLVRHSLDTECEQAARGYSATLVDPGTSFADWTLDRLLEAWLGAAIDDGERQWLDALSDRYVRLDLSDEAWRALRES